MNGRYAYLLSRRFNHSANQTDPVRRFLTVSLLPQIAKAAYQGMDFTTVAFKLDDKTTEALESLDYVVRREMGVTTTIEWGLQSTVDESGRSIKVTPKTYNHMRQTWRDNNPLPA